MKSKLKMIALMACLVLVASSHLALAAKTKAKTDVAEAAAESAYYRIITIPIPNDVVLECGGFELMPDNVLAVSTRRGDIYMVTGAYDDPPTKVTFSRWATGMHEVLGLAYNKKDGYLYAVQRGEVTRLKDTHNRGHADVYETFCDNWGISGDYHEYPWLSKFDKDGNLYVLLTLTGSFTSESEFRGWCLKITPEGKAVPFASGIRSPGGIGWNDKGELFYSDNQGPWNGGCALRQIVEGSFQGHPIGNKWYDKAPNMGTRPPDPQSQSRIYVEAKKIPELLPPAIIQPYEKLGQSQSGIACDISDGKFGPFAHQMFSADQHHSNIGRYVLEKVKGRYQGVCFPFREGFASGIVPMIQAGDGSIFVGGTNRGWGSRGPKEFSLERLVWTGKPPFEMYDMKLASDGFNITFTMPADKATVEEVANYSLKTFRYIYRSEYGSPEVDPSTCTVKKATLGADGKSVHLVVEGLQEGAIHELHVSNVQSADGVPLLHTAAYYTLWQFLDK